MKYDDVSWHFGSDEFPEDQPEEYAATHMALFCDGVLSRGWAGAIHLEQDGGKVQQVIEGTLSATTFLLEYSDGKLTNLSFSAQGNDFAKKYYGDYGLFLIDYGNTFGNSSYLVLESEFDFELFSAMLENRFQSGILTKQQLKPWWKFWF